MDLGSTGLRRSRLEARMTIDGSRESDDRWEEVAVVEVEERARKNVFGWKEGQG